MDADNLLSNIECVLNYGGSPNMEHPAMIPENSKKSSGLREDLLLPFCIGLMRK